MEQTDQIIEKFKYCLYSRKSTESEERQILSIDSQIKEMLQLAEKEGLDILAIKRESHSAKEARCRPVFNELLEDIKQEKYNAILTWAPDRLSRNGGDLGALVDLMDQGKLKEIRTFGQRFTDNPNEKFLLMILGSQAKLENDHRGINVKRGLRTRVEMGLWPGVAPIGYLNQKRIDKKCQVILDPERAHVVKKIFEKMAYEKWSGRKIYHWLRFELNFKTKGNKWVALSGVYRMLQSPFYYGTFEYPKESSNWYQGKHQPIIDQGLFDKVQEQLKRDHIVRESKEFAFTKMIVCGLCGSGITAEEKYKKLRDGTTRKYTYYGCTRSRDRQCKNKYIQEEELIKQLLSVIDKVDINELGMKHKLDEEIKRFNKFQNTIMGNSDKQKSPDDVDVRTYAKYLLQEGSIIEKRELLSNLKGRMVYTDKKISLIQQEN